jgi:putative ABC transport system permease protein
VVLCIILGIVILGIFNSISASILERKQEIGNLRANGESVLQIMRLIIAEGALLSLIGSILGIAFTYTVLMLFVHNQVLMPPGPGQTSQSLLSFTFDIPMGLKTTAYIAIAALLASFLAGIKVAKMPIAKALRSN